MNTISHLSIHIMFSLLSGLLVFRLWKKPVISFAAAIVSGVLVDLDHFIDYFLAFGTNFRLDYFMHGYQFLKSDKVYILFHTWEYVIILLAISFILKNKWGRSLVLGLALGLFFHLWADVFINNVPVSIYSIIKRSKNNFEIQKLAYPGHWEEHKRQKEITKFD